MSFLIENGILKKYNNDDNVTDVIIPDGVTEIGERAFQSANNIVSLTVPEGVIYIGKKAFSHCRHLTSLKLPDSLEEIGIEAFANCPELVDISIPPNVKKIKNRAFEECIKISKITLPPTLSEIEEGVFAGCEGLAEIKLPDSIMIINVSAFSACTALSEVTIPPSVGVLDVYAFKSCHNLRKVTIPKHLIGLINQVFCDSKNVVTNFSIKEWDKSYGIEKIEYAMNYMRNFKAGDPFFEDTKEENKRYIKNQLNNILSKDASDSPFPPLLFDNFNELFGIGSNDTNVVVFLTNEISLSIDQVEILLDKMQGNVEATAILLDYKKRNFTEEFLEKNEQDRMQKSLGIKKRSVADWKKIFRLRNDDEGGYEILSYKGKDTIVEIPEKIGQKPVIAIKDSAFSPIALGISGEMRHTRFSLETVIIPDSVAYIGSHVFLGCDKLNSILYLGKTFTPEEFEDYRIHNIPIRVIL